MTEIKVFENLAYLQSVRNDHLNPLIRRVEKELVPIVEKLEHDVSETIKNVTLTESTNTLRFDKGDGGYKDIVLTPILPTFEGIGVQTLTGSGPSTGIKLIQFPDATITQNGTSAAVGFNWQEVFEHNQKWPEAVVKGAVSRLKSIIFMGDADAVKVTGDNVTLTVPKVEPLTGSILSSSTSKKIEKIKVIGNVGGTTINDDGLLTIDLPAGGGGGGTVTNQNFKGFFDSLGDIISFVTDPLDGKSYAFAKDSTLGGLYYTPYFYVNGKWNELKQDPALTYNAPSAPTNQGVFSIKPSDKITLDANGQLDLDGLSTPQLPSYFKGFFDSLDDLKAAVPKPVIKQDWGYVRNAATGGLMAYRADSQGSATKWNVVAPMGSFAVIDKSTNPPTYRQSFGLYKDDAWEIDDKGILTLKSVNTKTNSEIVDYDGNVTTGQFDTIQFRSGKSYVNLNKNKLFIDHPQQIIRYDSEFESDHNTQDYEGNIFYDETSRTWMGWGIPETPGAVDVKWTKVLHRGMSDEVKDLSHRHPPKAPNVLPGILGDNRNWEYNGVTFIEKNSEHLPDEIENICGGYITTTVQDKDVGGYRIPQYRMQSCVADRPEGGTWVRRFDSAASPGSLVSWTPWVRTSFSHKDIEDHQKDIGAHKEAIKYHVVFALDGKLQSIFAQTAGNSLGGLHEDNGLMLVDNYGYTNEDKDYMDPPYSGDFRIAGVLSFSGYNEKVKTYPVGRWQILFRKRDKNTPNYAPVAQFNYVHTDEKKPYPSLNFLAKDIPLEDHQEVVINLTFDNPGGLRNNHPDLYLAPTRSYLVLEDNTTTSGTLVGEAHRKLYGNLDVFGDVGIRSHHSNLTDPNSSIRVYGEKLNKTPVDMTKI